MRTNRLPLLVFVVSALAGVASSAVQPTLAPSLATAKGLKCTFPLLATGTWDKGEPRAEVKPGKLAFAFEGIDTQEGTADAVGSFGPAHIVVRFSAGNLHFIQVATSGAVYVTTVFSRETTAGKRQAVHSRHEYTPVSLPGFTSQPEQYYGDCEIINR